MLALFALAVPERVLAVDAYVVASRVGTTWRVPDEGFVRRHPRLVLRPFGLGTAGGATREARLEWNENRSGIDLLGTPPMPFGPMLSGGAASAPRRVRTEKPTPVYEAACRRFLAGHGVAVKRARVTRVLRVDLDGDGTDETLVEASAGQPANAAPKESYSLVLLRTLRGGRVVETALECLPDLPGGALAIAQVRAIADLDGDGRMEVLTTTQGFEDESARLWDYRAGRTTMLVENGVGV